LYRWISGVVIAVVLLGVGAGCGGSDETESNVTKAQFVKKAGSICAEFKKERTAAAEKIYSANAGKEPESTEEVEKLGEEVLHDASIPSLNEQQEALESLELPADAEDKIEKMFDNLDQAIGEMEDEGIEALRNGNQFDPFEEEAEKYGLECEVI
jgi:hypothetical protein